jgi:hypothetical protein
MDSVFLLQNEKRFAIFSMDIVIVMVERKTTNTARKSAKRGSMP